jgi:hypothetical protein
MKTNIFFIAIDVDDKAFHGCGINKETGEIREFACRPTIGHLDKKLEGFKKDGSTIKVCYEATYLGFSLCRALEKKGYECDVIAPSLIPEKPGGIGKDGQDRLSKNGDIFSINAELNQNFLKMSRRDFLDFTIDGDGCGTNTRHNSLRRHDPDQVLRVSARRGSQPEGAPVVSIQCAE